MAVVGASARTGHVGTTVWRNLKRSGFAGPVWPVNRRRAKVQGDKAYARIADLPAVHAAACSGLSTRASSESPSVSAM